MRRLAALTACAMDFIVDTDVISVVFGSVQLQVQEGWLLEQNPVHGTAKPRVTPREILAFPLALEHSQKYLLGQDLQPRTWYSVLTWLPSIKDGPLAPVSPRSQVRIGTTSRVESCESHCAVMKAHVPSSDCQKVEQ
jgi:hypothetical protein